MKWRILVLITLLTYCTQPQQEEASQPEIVSLASPTNTNSSLPHLIKGEDNNLYMSWVEKNDSNWVDFKYAQLMDEVWSEPKLIASGNDWFVNWADYPMLAVDKDGNKIAHFLAKSSSGTYSYDVNVVLKPDSASGWSDAFIPHKDATPTEHGFVTILPNNDGTFLLAWLDGRNTGGEGHGGHGGAMTLRSAMVDMKGDLSEELELDNRVCDCCQTGGVITPDGALLIYRDRSVDEVRDMAFVSLSDTGWSQPKLVAEDDWKIEGCPVNGPRISNYNKTSAAGWFTSALSRPTVKVAFKQGSNFNEPIIIDDTSPIGRVDIAMIDENTAMVSWLDGGSESAIKYRKVNINGKMSSIQTVSKMSEARSSGFPQMETHNGFVYFAWTELNDRITTIRLSKSELQF